MCRELAVARPDWSGCLCISTRSLHLAPARESGLERCFHTDSSREFMDLDCTQQGILFSDERKNIQQPVFALGVLDTLPCFGIRHMPVVGVKRLSAGQKHSSPLPSCPRGGGCGRPSSSGRGEATPTPARPSPPCLGRRPPPGRGERAWAVLGEPAPAWGPLTASPVEYCISWL